MATAKKPGNAFDSVLEGDELGGETNEVCKAEMSTCLTEYCKIGIHIQYMYLYIFWNNISFKNKIRASATIL